MTWRINTIYGLAVLFLLGGSLYSDDLNGSENIAYSFTRIADDVYLATGNGEMFVLSNSVVIINEKDVVVVDSSASAATARALIADIKTLTEKPIGCVINTHHHFDHANGNQVFGPEVEIIGHEYARKQLMGDILHSKTYLNFTGNLPEQIEALQNQIAGETKAEKRDELEKNLTLISDFHHALAEIRPTPPNLTFNDRMSLIKGNREIQLLFLGRGHTGGDIFVYLPEEKVLCTGDFLGPSLSYTYMGDAYLDEWDDTLEKLKSIDFEVILPGHGAPMRTGEKIDHFQAYLRDLWQKTVNMRARGATADEVAEKIDLTIHSKNYPQITGPGAEILAVERIYQLLELRENN